MSNGYILEVGGIVGEDCAYLIRQNLEEQLGELDSFTCLVTKDGAEPAKYQCTFTMASSASLEAVTQCTFYPYKLMNIRETDAAIPLLRALIGLLDNLHEEKNMLPSEIRQIPSLLTKVEQNGSIYAFFNTKKKAQEKAIKMTTQKERLTPLPTMSMIDISEEEMAASAFGGGSHTAKNIKRIVNTNRR